MIIIDGSHLEKFERLKCEVDILSRLAYSYRGNFDYEHALCFCNQFDCVRSLLNEISCDLSFDDGLQKDIYDTFEDFYNKEA